MELRYGPNSPFSRKVRVAAIECGLRGWITLVRTSPLDPDSDLGTLNPLGKVPVLTTDAGEVLYDSPVICEYLDSLNAGAKLIPAGGARRWRVLRRQALGDGVLDALVFMRQVKSPEAGAPPSKTLLRQREKVDLSLDILEREAADLAREGVTIGAIAAATALGWLDYLFDDWDWRATRPALAAWYAEFARRPSMLETKPVRQG